MDYQTFGQTRAIALAFPEKNASTDDLEFPFSMSSALSSFIHAGLK